MTSGPCAWNERWDVTGGGWSAIAGSQMHSDELSMLLRVTDACSAGSSVGEILDSLYEELQVLIPFDRLEYAVIDETGYVLTTEWYRATYDTKLIPIGHSYRRSRRVATDWGPAGTGVCSSDTRARSAQLIFETRRPRFDQLPLFGGHSPISL